ncbi:kunitz-type protease inhibitor 2 [Phyllobates terribilis]|uniref:kunitz-type protease inhibitor 2 n=1 Tax=Phyllobates terribilis TaxID=111132 RepID=UPI003CCAA84B
MATWFSVLFVLLIPLALADNELPCGGFELVEGFGLENVEFPSQFGVNVLENTEDVEGERACWSRCCDREGCDLAVVSAGKCYLVRCNVAGFNMCDLKEQEGARTYWRPDAGAQPTLDDFCLAQKETGPCRAYFIRWWYDAESETCKNFTYGGCPVNLNNHAEEDECMEKCQGVQPKDTEAPPSEAMVSDTTVPEYCSGPGVTGNCRAAFPRWYYDAESKSCRAFIYGGCGGSTNNHMSEQDCMAKCPANAPKPEPAKVHAPEKGDFKEYCAAPAYTGPCRAAFKRWYYDSSTGTCQTFVFGGCKPKSNNYMTETDCKDMCSGRTEGDDFADHSVLHRSLPAVVLPILLALLAAILIGVMILFFVKVTRRNQETAGFRAMWNPIDDKECLMNSAYTL